MHSLAINYDSVMCEFDSLYVISDCTNISEVTILNSYCKIFGECLRGLHGRGYLRLYKLDDTVLCCAVGAHIHRPWSNEQFYSRRPHRFAEYQFGVDDTSGSDISGESTVNVFDLVALRRIL